MMEWLRKRSLPARILMYALAGILAFALAAGVGATGALMISGDLSSLIREEEPRPSDEQAKAPRENASPPQQNQPAQQQEKDAAAEQEERDAAAEQQQEEEEAAQQREAEEDYLANVGEIQTNAVETFLDSHQKLLRYDALGGDDLEQMRANDAALGELSSEVENLAAPQGYEDQYEVFRSAIDELRAAVRLAYEAVSDPTTVTKADFDNYDRHAQEGAELLERSNEILGRDYKTIEGVQEISPL